VTRLLLALAAVAVIVACVVAMTAGGPT